MGYFKTQIVNLITYNFDNNDPIINELDSFISKHLKYFAKSEEMINSYLNYVMFYDGSKEGWDDSEEADEIREAFIKISEKLYLGELYEINHPEDGPAELKHTRIHHSPFSIEGKAVTSVSKQKMEQEEK